ncbi:hypothetical protein ACFVZW_22955 [Streptomyces sp. NPDC059567]|uniref:hypothetical protein n=1 Tax=Streptomyces sp. NPDC059567 TaxID=3346867 RepID=UPI0036C5A84E
MFRRKGKGAAEASTEEAQAVALTEAPEEAEKAEVATPAAGDSETEAPEGVRPGETAETAAVVDAVESVEIPKQQSAEAAADNKAGEGARK